MKTALYHIRTRCNYSQSMAARELQVSRQIFSAWEQGKKQIPEGRKAMLASLFGVPIQILDTENEAEIQDFCDRPMFSTICQGKAGLFFLSPSNGTSRFSGHSYGYTSRRPLPCFDVPKRSSDRTPKRPFFLRACAAGGSAA